MAPYILAALILVPLAEIVVFIEVGGLIGALPTVALVVAIAILGTWLLRRQGLDTFRKTQEALNRGEMPVTEMLDGFFLVFASLLMVTPGLLTDAIGLLLLVPSLRRRFGRFALGWLMAHTKAEWAMSGSTMRGGAQSGGPIIEGEAETVEPERGEPERGRPPSISPSPWREPPPDAS